MQNLLDRLYDKYRSNIIVWWADMEAPVDIGIIIPRKMVEEYMQITSSSRKKPISFWKNVFRRRLLKKPPRNINLTPDELKDAFDYLNCVYARFTPIYHHPSKILLSVEERSRYVDELK